MSKSWIWIALIVLIFGGNAIIHAIDERIPIAIINIFMGGIFAFNVWHSDIRNKT